MTDGNITQCSQPWWQTVGISLLFDIDGDNLTKMKTEEYDDPYMSSSLMMTYDDIREHNQSWQLGGMRPKAKWGVTDSRHADYYSFDENGRNNNNDNDDDDDDDDGDDADDDEEEEEYQYIMCVWERRFECLFFHSACHSNALHCIICTG